MNERAQVDGDQEVLRQSQDESTCHRSEGVPEAAQGGCREDGQEDGQIERWTQITLDGEEDAAEGRERPGEEPT